MKKDLTKIFNDEIYSKPPKKNYPTNKITYNHIDKIWSIDRADMIDYKISNNKGFSIYSSLLIIIANISGQYLLKINIVKLSQTNFQTF